MNILLWVLQVALAWLCIAGGYFQIFKLDDLQKGVASMRSLPNKLWKFMGGLGILCGILLILPGVMRIFPEWVAYAAAVVAVQSLLISAFYIKFKDFSPMYFSAAMTIIAAFICYGRLVLSPL